MTEKQSEVTERRVEEVKVPEPQAPEAPAKPKRWDKRVMTRNARRINRRLRKRQQEYDFRIGELYPGFRKPYMKDGLRCCKICANLEITVKREEGVFPWGETRTPRLKKTCSMGIVTPYMSYVCYFWAPLNEKVNERVLAWDDKNLKSRHRFERR